MRTSSIRLKKSSQSPLTSPQNAENTRSPTPLQLPSQSTYPCATHSATTPSVGSSTTASSTDEAAPLIMTPTEHVSFALQLSKMKLSPSKRKTMGEELKSCSCDSTEFDALLAVIGDSKSMERLRGQTSMTTPNYGSSNTLSTLRESNVALQPKSRLNKRIIVSAVANLSTAYNLAVINYALMMIRHSYPPSAPEVTSTVVSCSLVGAIMGQVTFGYIGDAIGRRKGMIFTLLLSIIGALASALVPWGETTIYPLLATCRFILGLGVGGVYPLSATTAIESSHDQSKNSKIVAAVFSFQGLGQLLAPLVTYTILWLGIGHSAGWRILLGAGALPGLFVLQSAMDSTETCDYRSSRLSTLSVPDLIKKDHSLVHKLIGAGFGWFLFDITFYGNVIFTPIILQHSFGFDGYHLKDVAYYSLIVAAIGLPGYITTIFAVKYMEFRSIQIMGFVVMAVLFSFLGLFYQPLLDQTALLLLLYAMTFYFSNFGPNVSTFCLPAEIFPSSSRVKLNGIAAASGKIGATVGAAMFGMVENVYGVPDVLILSSIVSILGALVTYWFIPSKQHR